MYCIDFAWILILCCLVGRNRQAGAANLPPSELNALQCLYDSTNGSHWAWTGNEVRWNFSGDPNPCEEGWYGVGCTRPESDGFLHVKNVSLNRFHLQGTLPPQLGNLSMLDTFTLSQNALVGTVLPALGRLKNLTFLNVSFNHLTGSLPPQLGDLKQLTHMDLSINKLTGPLPSELGGLTSLTSMRLSKNHLIGPLPPELRDMTSLTSLDLSSNYLTGSLPPELVDMTSLSSLDLFDNYLTGSLPPELGNRTSLTYLSLEYNQLTESLPPELVDMTSLTSLALSGNDLTGSLPPKLGDMTSLTFLDLFNNYLTGSLPPEMGDMTSLTSLDLSDNYLTGSLPPELGDMTSLTFLHLMYCHLTGPLPPELGKMTSMRDLNLYNNQLTGPLPPKLGDMTSLTYLSLSNNHLTGSLPPELGNITSMWSLYLLNNQLTGPLPPELGNMTSLTYLRLGNNHLTGSLPPELGNMTSMWDLELDNNQLTGPLPPELGGMTSLEFLILHDNQYSGSLPLQLRYMTSLKELYLDNNHFSKELPSQLGDALIAVSAGRNYLQGSIPAALLGSKVLQYLDLRDNILSGWLSSLLSIAGNLKYFSVAHNRLCGCLPKLSDLWTLQEMDLSYNQFGCSLAGVFASKYSKSNSSLITVQLEYNQFSGTLPPEIFQLPRVHTIVAVSNCFTGTLPVEVCQAHSMQSLILDGVGASKFCPSAWTTWQQDGVLRASPRFHGTIPQCIFSLANLTSLHLSGNNLVGPIPTNVALNQKLTQLSLSHNRLTGSLPEQIQTHPWSSLDVSYNKFDGTLSPAFGNGTLELFAPNCSIQINNSRISGTIPSAMMQLRSITMLGSNMFSCKVDKSNLPDADSDKQRYQCGSDAFNYAFYMFLSMSGSVLLTILLAVYTAPKGFADVSKWRLPRESLPQSCQYVHVTMSILTQVSMCVTAAILLILVPWYVTASYYFGTYTHQYAWVVSAAFLSGLAPGLVNFFVWFTLVLFGVRITGYVGYHLRSEILPGIFRTSSVIAPAVDHREAPAKPFIERAKVYLFFLSVNLIMVIGANTAFVYVSLNESTEVVLLAQVALSLWKFVWNTICVPHLVNQLSQRLMLVKQSSGFFRVYAFVSLFNNIAVPCLVVAAQSPSCFRDLIFPPSPLTSSYTVQSCEEVSVYDNDIFQSDALDCSNAALASKQTKYSPQFSYSYECSSSFVTYYSASLIYLALTTAVIVPAVYCVLIWVASGTSLDGGSEQRWAIAALPRIWRPLVLEPGRSSTTIQDYYLNANSLIVNMTVYLGLLLSFGVVFPPVALAMCVAMLSTAYQTYLSVGRLLLHARELGANYVVDMLEADCKHVATVKKLQSVVIMVVAFACSFYALFIFDTVGDAEGFARACWALILPPLLPAGVYTVVRYVRSQREQRRQQELSASANEMLSVEMVHVQGQAAPEVQEAEEGRNASTGAEAIVNVLHT